MATHPLVVVTGDKAIDRKLRGLIPLVQKKIARKAVRGGMKYVATFVHALVPVLTGTTRRNIVVRTGLRQKRGSISMDVRIDANAETRTTSAASGKTYFYPAIVEYKFDDFMARAFRASAEQARRLAIAILEREVEREVRRG